MVKGLQVLNLGGQYGVWRKEFEPQVSDGSSQRVGLSVVGLVGEAHLRQTVDGWGRS